MQIKAPHPFCVTEYTCTWHNARTKVDKISPSGKIGPQKAHLILQACDSWHKPLIFLIIPAQLFLQIYGALLSDRLPQLIHIAGWCGLSRYSHLPLWRTNGKHSWVFLQPRNMTKKSMAWLTCNVATGFLWDTYSTCMFLILRLWAFSAGGPHTLLVMGLTCITDLQGMSEVEAVTKVMTYLWCFQLDRHVSEAWASWRVPSPKDILIFALYKLLWLVLFPFLWKQSIVFFCCMFLALPILGHSGVPCIGRVVGHLGCGPCHNHQSTSQYI